LRGANCSPSELKQSLVGEKPILQFFWIDPQHTGNFTYQLSTSIGAIRRNPVGDHVKARDQGWPNGSSDQRSSGPADHGSSCRSSCSSGYLHRTFANWSECHLSSGTASDVRIRSAAVTIWD
jgi:hypothetical protein